MHQITIPYCVSHHWTIELVLLFRRHRPELRQDARQWSQETCRSTRARSTIFCTHTTFHEQAITEHPGKLCPPSSLSDAGMDLSGLSDPFCVVFWNDREVGRTAVRYGTRDPDWAGDDSSGRVHEWFTLPFSVPEADKWGEQAWPPMCLEVCPSQV